MASPVDQALEVYGASQLEQSFGVNIVLQRGSDQSSPIVATWAKRELQIQGESGYPVTVQSIEFKFPPSKAVVGGVLITPRTGDQIVMEGGAVYELLPTHTTPSVNIDPNGFRLTLLTKQVS